MELNFWTSENFLLADEWGLDLSDVQPNGQFGDLKTGHDLSNSASTPDAVGGTMVDLSPASSEDVELEWMESSDLGSYLDVLDVNQENQMLPIESALYELNPAPPTDPILIHVAEKEDLVSFDPSGTYDSSAQISKITSPVPTLEPDAHLWSTSLETAPAAVASFDALVSPPDSPIQVAPVIKLEEIESEEPSWILPLDQDLLFSELDFSATSISDNSYVHLDDASLLISSPLSVDDVEDTLLSSVLSSPSSPETSKTSVNSIIDTCPELYKVISSSSIQQPGNNRFSPYQKAKSSTITDGESKSTPKSGRKRAPAEPVPEHIIIQQVNKKDRKKLQNKNAAIRYRMKKKEEAKGIKSEEDLLEEHNLSLKTKVEDLEREVKYMKNLMEEVYKAKGIIKG